MSGKAKFVLYKVITVALILFIVNLIFIFFYPTVFNSVYFSITLILFNLFVALDKIFQPPAIYGKKEKTRDVLYKARFLILFLFLNPILFTLPYLEYSFIAKTTFAPEATLVFWVLGDLILVIGGITICTSRFILGKESTVIIGIEKDHKLITKGSYRIVRHPIYSGIIFFFLGYALSFSGIVSSVILLLVVIPWFGKRIALEEKLLIQTFGDEYLQYMKHTKRLIPFIY